MNKMTLNLGPQHPSTHCVLRLILELEGEKVIFIGDGNNDVEAMRLADIAIASGLTHMPAKSVLSVANYLVFSEEALCRQLNQLL